jgi:predicted O-methyltransferase YrrM
MTEAHMKRERIPETDRGIQGEANVASYDEFMRYMRDGNRLQIEELASMDFKGPDVLEVGPGCGYVGLELLKRLPAETHWTGYQPGYDRHGREKRRRIRA